MSLELKEFDGLVGLHAVCDICLKHVKADQANMLFEQHPDCNEFLRFIACKGKCTLAADRAKKSKWQWISLDIAIASLINNSKLDVDASLRQAGALSLVT